MGFLLDCASRKEVQDQDRQERNGDRNFLEPEHRFLLKVASDVRQAMPSA